MQAARIVSPYFNRKSVIETQRRTERKVKTPVIFRLHALVYIVSRALRFFLQNRGQRGSRVFRIEVDASREDGLMANEGSRQIKAPLDAKTGFAFQPLCENLAQDRLFGEVLRAHHNAVFARGTARRQKETRNEEDRNYVAHGLIRPRLVCARSRQKPRFLAALGM